MRDDFSQRIKGKLASRAAHRCSNPGCRAATSGPQLIPDQSVSVGVAAHISAAAAGGPRFDPALSPTQRGGIGNGIWLCQLCAKLIDADALRYPSTLLRQWKITAEQEAQREIGKSRHVRTSSSISAERRIKGELKLRDRMRADFLKNAKDYEKEFPCSRPPRHPYSKFRHSEVIVHRLDDDCYPNIDNRPGISSWFKLELFDFYHRGIVVILDIERGLITNGHYWTTIAHDVDFDPSRFTEVKIWRLGKIPFRNIRHYDLHGDEFYNCPHLYCAFDNDDMPYEAFSYALVGEDGEYDWPLQADRRLQAAG